MDEFKKCIIELLSKEETSECKSATILRKIGTIIVILAIIGGVISFFCTLTTLAPDRSGYLHSKFNTLCLLWLFCPIISSVVTWAFAIAVADIAENSQKAISKEKTEEIEEEED